MATTMASLPRVRRTPLWIDTYLVTRWAWVNDLDWHRRALEADTHLARRSLIDEACALYAATNTTPTRPHPLCRVAIGA